MTKKTTKQKEIEYIDKVVKVPEMFHPKTEQYLETLKKECILSRTQLIEAILFESEIESRRYGLFSIANKMQSHHQRIERERQ